MTTDAVRDEPQASDLAPADRVLIVLVAVSGVGRRCKFDHALVTVS